MPTTPLRFRQIHLDFHTPACVEGIAADFDAERFADTLAAAHVNSVTVFARCHHGMLYYPSKVNPERVHPHLQKPDLLREQIEACHARGIRAPIYITVQWDQFTADAHRDWLCLDVEGREYQTKPLDAGFYKNLDVYHPGYRQFMFDHTGEVLDLFPVDGIFFDIVQPRYSVAPHWLAGMAEAGLDPQDPTHRGEFAQRVLDEWKIEMTRFVREWNADCTIFYNAGHIGPADRPTMSAYSHFEVESLPSGGWGYAHFPVVARYVRALEEDGQRKPFMGMTGKFHTSWGDFHSYKSPAALEFECFRMLATGGGCSVGDQLPPRGVLDGPTYDLIGKVYASVAEKEPWCAGATPVAEAAVFMPEVWKDSGWERHPEAAAGAVNVLEELRVQFDFVDTSSDLSAYPLLILPDDVKIDQKLEEKLRTYLDGGGNIIGSHKAAHPLLGVESVGDAEFNPDFLVPGPGLAEELEGTPHVMYMRAMGVKPLNGSEVLASVERPYFNRTFAHYFSHKHAPSNGEDAGYPGIVRGGEGNTIYFAHPIFRQYRSNAPHWVRTLLREAIDTLLPRRIVQIDGPTNPTTLQANLLHQAAEDRHVLHLLHYIPTRRGQAFDTIDDVIPLHDVRVDLAIEGPVQSVRLVPSGQALEHDWSDGSVTFTVPLVEGHAMVELLA